MLRALHERHPAAIPFETFDVLLDRGVDLSPAAVESKLIRARRGGYCFEHNLLFKRALTALGFQVEGLVARVRWMQPAEAPPRPRTHMALRVTVDGVPWLADVGFGGCVLTSPLRLDTPSPQATGHEDFRVFPFGGDWLVQVRIDGTWCSLYQVSPEPQLEADYELPNWYTSTHPKSHFRHRLMVARAAPEARYTLAESSYTVRRPSGSVERHSLDADTLERVLRETFQLPVEPDWRPVIERAASGAPSPRP